MSEATAELVYRCTVCHAVYTAGERFCPLDAGPIKPEDQHTDPRIGKTIDGRYFIRRLIGRGGMGAVYEADHVGLDKRVAVKFLSINKSDRDALARFRREAKIASRIVHEHVVHIYDVGTADADTDFIVMEFLKGQDLAVTLREDGPLSAARTISILRKVLRGLRAIHQAGIVHRDIKPANILISPREEDRDFVKIMDFGISKPIRGETITNTGAIIGTPEYMSPEQLLGEDVDPRADLYAIGIMAFRMLTGKLPFTTETFDRASAANPYVPVPSLAATCPGLPRELVNAIEKATAKDRDDRYADAQAFITDLEAIPMPSHAVAPAQAKARTSPIALAGADTAVPHSPPGLAATEAAAATADLRGHEAQATERALSSLTSPTARSSGPQPPPAVQAAGTLQTMAPSHASTPMRRSRTGLWIAIALIVVGGAVTSVVLLRGDRDPQKIVLEPQLLPPSAPSPPPEGGPQGGNPRTPSDRDKMTAALQKAREAESRGMLEDALVEYQIAYTIDPSAETTYAIAELYERIGKKADAVRFFERYLTKDAPNREGVTKRIAELQGIAAKPAGAQPAVASRGSNGNGGGSATVVTRDGGLRPCHCIPQDRRDTVSMCAKKGPSMCRCQPSNGGALCPVPVVKCPDCPDGSRSCWSKNCNSSGFECPDPSYDKQRKPGKHGTACSGYEDWQIAGLVDGKLDCDHCDVISEPRQFKGHEGEECTGYYRSTGEKLKGWLICY